ncbi:MAG: hypothetical protein H0W81_06535 [Chloroflexi bacterium]|nr:hypothetical protein [Chloroflexota bacterium]
MFGVMQKSIPDLVKAIGEFRHEYAEHNYIELDRVQARARFGPEYVRGEDGKLEKNAKGDLLTLPSMVDRITEEDWERSGQKFRMPDQPSSGETAAFMLPLAFEQAQEPTQRLIALMCVSNADVSRWAASGTLYEELDSYYAANIDTAPMEDVLELAVSVAEQFDASVLSKARGLSERMGKLRATVFGEEKKPVETPTTSSPSPDESSTSSVTSTPESSDGDPETSSSSPGISSQTSEPSLLTSA